MFHHFYSGALQVSDDGETYLETLVPMDVGYMGEPFVAGQVNLTNGDSDLLAMDIGYMGEPFVVWTNIE